MSDATATQATDDPERRGSVDTIIEAAEAAVKRGFVIAVALTWVAFWGIVVRLQFVQDEFLSAAVTGLAFILPAFVGLIAYLDPLPDPRRLVPG